MSATLYHLPGPDGLRRVVAAARDSGGNDALLRACEARIEELERLLEAEGVTRETLRVMLGAYLPEVRASQARDNCRAAFSAMSNLAGYYADTMVGCMILLPGSTPDSVHLSAVRGFVGWRRLREDPWCFTQGHRSSLPSDAQHPVPMTLDGVPVSQLDQPALLEEFCSDPPPRFVPYPSQGWQMYALDDHEVGIRSRRTFYIAELMRDAEQRYASQDTTFAMETGLVTHPYKNLVFDVLLHAEVWPGSRPTLEFYRTAGLGPVSEWTRSQRQHDRVDMFLAPLDLGLGLPRIECSAVGDYRRVVEHVLARLGHGPGSFRGYRCQMDYPLYGVQLSMLFELPSRPADTA
ncbi:MAG: hypothetical protein H6811_02430 [Phycisphaeraceae bacterium]|nr:hypothetical protein [Phycisphaeraceae bacterium]